MYLIARSTILCLAAGALLGAATVSAAVTFVGNDHTTDAKWRTAATVKPDDLDGDNVYGTAGYFLAAGKRAGYVDPFLSGTPILTTHADGLNTLPSYIASLAYTDPAQRGRSWGGSGGNFGTLDTVPGSTGLTGAAILLRPGSAAAMSLTLKRSNSPAFRLTLILGNNPNENGFNDPSGQDVTVDDGSGPLTRMTGDAGRARRPGTQLTNPGTSARGAAT
ncbi:MAG: hypothetical protein FJ387_19925 [Verrucomicrobia bacterium]|nr:hypothetical protein [Verrucomicrobiota bacterium]